MPKSINRKFIPSPKSAKKAMYNQNKYYNKGDREWTVTEFCHPTM